MSFVELTGPAKLDKRTKNLVKRLSADDIAIIDHTDLDRVSAEALLESGVRVVVNVAPSQSGRFPNPGPLQLVRGGPFDARADCPRSARLQRMHGPLRVVALDCRVPADHADDRTACRADT